MKAERAVRAGKSRRMAARILIQYRRQRAGAGDEVRPEPSNDAHSEVHPPQGSASENRALKHEPVDSISHSRIPLSNL